MVDNRDNLGSQAASQRPIVNISSSPASFQSNSALLGTISHGDDNIRVTPSSTHRLLPQNYFNRQNRKVPFAWGPHEGSSKADATSLSSEILGDFYQSRSRTAYPPAQQEETEFDAAMPAARLPELTLQGMLNKINTQDSNQVHSGLEDLRSDQRKVPIDFASAILQRIQQGSVSSSTVDPSPLQKKPRLHDEPAVPSNLQSRKQPCKDENAETTVSKIRPSELVEAKRSGLGTGKPTAESSTSSIIPCRARGMATEHNFKVSSTVVHVLGCTCYDFFVCGTKHKQFFCSLHMQAKF